LYLKYIFGMQNPSRTPGLSAAIEEERALDRAFHRHAANQAARQSGVCWSGPPVPAALDRTPEEIEAAARSRLKRHQTWLAQETTTWLQAMIELQALARGLHGLAERGREAWSRGLNDELAGADDLTHRIQDQIPVLRQALNRARSALQALQNSRQTR
jgi:hypothetical protein